MKNTLTIGLFLCFISGVFAQKTEIAIKYNPIDCINCQAGFYHFLSKYPEINLYCRAEDKYTLEKFLIESYDVDYTKRVKVYEPNSYMDTVQASCLMYVHHERKKILSVKKMVDLKPIDYEVVDLIRKDPVQLSEKSGTVKLTKGDRLLFNYIIELSEDDFWLVSRKGRIWDFNLKKKKAIPLTNIADSILISEYYSSLFHPMYLDSIRKAHPKDFDKDIKFFFQSDGLKLHNGNPYVLIEIPFYLKKDTVLNVMKKNALVKFKPKFEGIESIYALPIDLKLSYSRFFFTPAGDVIFPHYDTEKDTQFVFYKSSLTSPLVFEPYFPMLKPLDSLAIANKFTHIANVNYESDFLVYPFKSWVSSNAKLCDFTPILSFFNVPDELVHPPFEFNGMIFDINTFSQTSIFIKEDKIYTWFTYNNSYFQACIDKSNMELKSIRLITGFSELESKYGTLKDGGYIRINPQTLEYRVERFLN